MYLLVRLFTKVAIIEILNYFDLIKLNQHLELHLVHFIFSCQQSFILVNEILTLGVQLLAKIIQVRSFDLKIFLFQLDIL
jgi:hypothetical protein